MRLRNLGIVMLVILVIAFIAHPKIQADSIPSVSYSQLIEEHKNDVPSEPVRLMIPTAKIDADVEKVGLVGDKMDVPKQAENVGWYEYGYRPGEKGNSVLAGHFDTENGEEAVFWKLGLLRLHDRIYIEDKDGTEYSFVVTDMQEYPHTSVPLTTLFTKSLKQNLVLITCSGNWNDEDNTYSNRLLVTATLINE